MNCIPSIVADWLLQGADFRAWSQPWRRLLLSSCCLASLAAIHSDAAPRPHSQAKPKYLYVGRLGLHDAAHTSADGFQRSDVVDMNANGQTIGTSSHYGGGQVAGISPWIATTDAVTARIGFYDAAHTRSDGLVSSAVAKLTDSGRAIGQSRRFSGTDGDFNIRAPQSLTAWLADASGTTSRIGLYEGTYTRDGWYHVSRATDVSESGYVVGTSTKFEPADITIYWGITAWIINPAGELTVLGIDDPAHQNQGGNSLSDVAAVNASGWSAGTTQSYVGYDFPGRTAWVADASGAITIVGLYDAAHGSNGYFVSEPIAITDSGWVIGHSDRLLGGFPSLSGTQSAWVATTQGVTTIIGLYDAGHTRTDGYVRSVVLQSNEAGVVVGGAERYNGDTYLGDSAWFASAASGTTRVGLTDAEHTSATGFQNSRITGLTEAGRFRGYSERYLGGSSSRGFSAWFGDTSGAITVVGLDDPLHTRDDGYQTNFVGGVTESGFAWGASQRYHGDSTADGQTAWVYNPRHDSLTALEFSVRPADGFAYTNIVSMTKTGLAHGTYTLFDETGVDLGERPFVWTPKRGLVDLEGILDVSPEEAGWLYLSGVVEGSDSGFVAGSAIPLDAPGDSVGAFLAHRKQKPSTPPHHHPKCRPHFRRGQPGGVAGR